MKAHYVYTLKLEGGRYYVGSSTSPKHRLEQHKRGGKAGAAWTSKHKPLKVLSCTKVTRGKGSKHRLPRQTRQAEDRKTRQLMKKHGVAKVRGGAYTQVKLDEETKQGLQKHVKHGKRLNAHCKRRESWHQQNLCTRCGSRRHWANKCKGVV